MTEVSPEIQALEHEAGLAGEAVPAPRGEK